MFLLGWQNELSTFKTIVIYESYQRKCTLRLLIENFDYRFPDENLAIKCNLL